MSASPNASEQIHSFRPPKLSEWQSLAVGSDTDENAKRNVEQAKESLNQTLLSSLKMEHFVVLAGSGCSLSVGGPSMTNLWNAVVGEAPSDEAKEVAAKVYYAFPFPLTIQIQKPTTRPKSDGPDYQTHWATMPST